MNDKEIKELALKLLMDYDFKKHKKKFSASCSVIGSKQLFNSGWVAGYIQCQQYKKAVA